MRGLAVYAVIEREVVRMARQRVRLLSALVRPLIWLFVIGAGFGAVMEGAGTDYQRYLVPGVLGMTLLFGAMLAALSMVFDKESGVMRMLIVAPMAHTWIVVAKLLSSALAAIVQALLLLAVLAALGLLGEVRLGVLALALLATSLACGGIGILVAAFTRTLENYAAIMNFVIFPVFFLSGSLYPVERLPQALRAVALANPYTYGVDLLKHAFGGAPAGYGAEFGLGTNLAVLSGFTVVALAVAGWRFSRESAHEPLIHRLTGKAGG